MRKIPYLYNFYGSSDSIDTDVIIDVTLPYIEEDKKRLIQYIKSVYDLDWNVNAITTYKGKIISCMNSKSSMDSINNALLTTYGNHNQDCECLVDTMVNRNVILATYKTIRQICANLTRTQHRELIRPTIRGQFGIDCKIKNLKEFINKGGFKTIDTFNQRNTSDIDIWKTTAFYLGQNLSLLDGIELYEKSTIKQYHTFSIPFIDRKHLSDKDKENLNNALKNYLDFLQSTNIEFDGKYIWWNLDNTVANIIDET
jgi:hypothetical protein